MAVAVSFNGNSLQTFDGSHGIIVQQIQHAGKTTKLAQAYALSHGNKSTIPFIEYPNKPITLTGQIVGTSIADCDSIIDTFNSYFTTKDANLDFDYNGSTRRYVATAIAPDVDRPGHLAWANFTVSLLATVPFGKDTSNTTLVTGSGRTLGAYTDSVTVAGNAPYQLPVITITYSAIGSAPVAGTVSVGNDTTGQQINVNRTWAVSDVLVIDCTANTVTVNGVAVAFTGAFPDFAPGAGQLDYFDNFASRTFNYSVVYTKMYL